jgi:NADH:ubiquinone oxidoreductase subunit 3 (subunit A)
MHEYLSIGAFALVGLLFGGGAMVVSHLLAPRFPNQGQKLEAYESGEKIFGNARIQFRVSYYLFALVFLVFDVEAIFLFPALLSLKPTEGGPVPGGLIHWLEVLVFVLILAFALVYAWRKRVLEWE